MLEDGQSASVLSPIYGSVPGGHLLVKPNFDKLQMAAGQVVSVRYGRTFTLEFINFWRLINFIGLDTHEKPVIESTGS